MDFSAFKNINFTDPENLLFLAIVFILIIVVLSVIFLILMNLAKAVKRMFVNMPSVKIQKPGLEEAPTKSQNNFIEGSESSHKDFRIMGGDFISNFKISDKKNKEQESPEVKKQKSIAGSLASLKSHSTKEEKETLQTKMPSRTEGEQEKDGEDKIKIARPNKFDNRTEPEGLKNSSGVISEEIKIPRPQHFSSTSAKNAQLSHERAAEAVTDSKHSSEDISRPKENHGLVSDGLFDDGREVSRIKLEHEMKHNPKIWQAARESMFNISPIERSKLVKEVFSSAYGSSISKTDLKGVVKKLNNRLSTAKNQAEHAKIRKEIKFFKKIGGLK
jgi:hypothetical protein